MAWFRECIADLGLLDLGMLLGYCRRVKSVRAGCDRRNTFTEVSVAMECDSP